MRFSKIVPSLAAAAIETGHRQYSEHANRHLSAWFSDASTKMNPNLQYAQAIQGRTTGRGIGIIDTIHLVEVARAAQVLEDRRMISAKDGAAFRTWFVDYLKWMTTDPKGLEEREAKNNHGTCWVMQVAAFAAYTRNRALLDVCRERYTQILVPTQIAVNGSFPLELKRTKPYSYSLFNLEAMSAICQILSTPTQSLWTYKTADGRGIERALEFMFPYIENRSSWPFEKDVMYFAEWPVRQSSLLFGGIALRKPVYIAKWKVLNPDPTVEEVVRNFPIRQPVLWMFNDR